MFESLIKNERRLQMYHTYALLRRVYEGQPLETLEDRQTLISFIVKKSLDEYGFDERDEASHNLIHAILDVTAPSFASMGQDFWDERVLSFRHNPVLFKYRIAGLVQLSTERRFLKLVIRHASYKPVWDLLGFHSSMREALLDELTGRAENEPLSFRASIDLDDFSTFVYKYKKVLTAKAPRTITGVFSTAAAEANMDLPPDLLAHAFPDYPVTDAVLELAQSDSTEVVNSTNFRHHYEHLILLPNMNKIPLVSPQFLGIIQDVDVVWKYLYRMKDRADKRRAMGENYTMEWAVTLASTYEQGAGFSKIPLVERIMFYRKSRAYLHALLKRAAIFGEITDELLDLTDSTNVIRELISVTSNLTAEQFEALKLSAPGVSIMMLGAGSR